ncbi:hypothetical protein MTO96_001219 [Rhipicephalus appendiculatus]
MEYQVLGVDIDPEEITPDQGWQTASSRRVLTQNVGPKPTPPYDALKRDEHKPRDCENVKNKIIRASRMPQLPKDDIRIIIRPRGGLNIARVGPTIVADAISASAGISPMEQHADTLCPNSKQNILVASTPKREIANRYVRVKEVWIADKTYEVSAYKAAPHSTCKGVIRGIPVQDGSADIDTKIVNDRNPLALAAKRIGSTTAVIVAFDGHRVPNFVRYGSVLLQCTLYSRQTDICCACGRLGHRADVCPNPGDVICRGCSASNPDQEHQCTPKCKLCGGAHLTADKAGKERYHIPYVVRRRRWERARSTRDNDDREATSEFNAAADDDETSELSTDGRSDGRRSRSRGRSKNRSKRASRSRSCPRSRSRSARRGTPHWINIAGLLQIPFRFPSRVPLRTPPRPHRGPVNNRRAHRHHHRQATPTRISEELSLGRTPSGEKETLHHR